MKTVYQQIINGNAEGVGNIDQSGNAGVFCAFFNFGQKFTTAIDFRGYLAKAKPAISAMLQHIIDHKWTESKMYLILCGSSMSFMESQVLGKESPLYGRRTGQFKIEPLDYKETAVFHLGHQFSS